MTHRLDSRAWNERFPLGTASPHSCEHLGMVYPGEVVRSVGWSPQWAGPLSCDIYYRIVLLQETPAAGSLLSAPADRRTAVCLPSSSDTRRLARLTKELETVDQAAYLTRRSADAATVGQTLQQRRRTLGEDIWAEWRRRYAEGEIISSAATTPHASLIFSEDGPLSSVDRLAANLLEAAYPELPIAVSGTGARFDSEDAAGIFAEAFGNGEPSRRTFRRWGPLLGLSTEGTPDQLDASGCRVFDLLRRKLQDSLQPASFAEIQRYLAHELGLTGPLSTLFLLLFLNWETPELEVRLSDGHGLTVSGGRPLLAARLTSDVVPSLDWNAFMAERLATIGPLSPPTWNDARHHLSALCPDIGDNSAGEDQEAMEPRLLRGVAMMLGQVQSFSGLLESLQDTGGATPESAAAEALTGSLSRLGLISGDGYEAVYAAIRSTYRDLSYFERDLEDLSQINELSGYADDIRQGKMFMAGAVVPPNEHPVLAVDRQTLLSAMSLASLVQTGGRGWPAVAKDLASFQASYLSVYANHHELFYQALSAYQRDLASGRRQLQAVGLLDTLPELGPPVAEGLIQKLSSMPDGPEGCDVARVGLATTSPRCPECGLSLEDSLPVNELTRLTPAIEAALAEKTRCLSGQLVGKVLNHRTGPQFGKLLKIVQASELTALSNTLDPELLALIRSVLD